jgi:hypothetical protein
MPYDEALLLLLVARIEGDAVGDLLNGIAVEIDVDSYMPSGWYPGVGMGPAIEWHTSITNTVPVSPRTT